VCIEVEEGLGLNAQKEGSIGQAPFCWHSFEAVCITVLRQASPLRRSVTAPQPACAGASWPSAAGGGSAIHWRHFLPWCPGTLSGGNFNAGLFQWFGPQRAAPIANPDAFKGILGGQGAIGRGGGGAGEMG
jgi:hypothetical protein